MGGHHNKLVPTLIQQTVTGDTHAAVLNNPDDKNATNDTPAVVCPASTNNLATAGSGTTEVIISTTPAISVASGDTVVCNLAIYCKKITNDGTITYRVKRGGNTLISATTASITTNNGIFVIDPDTWFSSEPAGNNQYALTVQPSTNSCTTMGAIDIQTWNASLSGSQGTCQI